MTLVRALPVPPVPSPAVPGVTTSPDAAPVPTGLVDMATCYGEGTTRSMPAAYRSQTCVVVGFSLLVPTIDNGHADGGQPNGESTCRQVEWDTRPSACG
jgi:hypothetical protein